MKLTNNEIEIAKRLEIDENELRKMILNECYSRIVKRRRQQ